LDFAKVEKICEFSDDKKCFYYALVYPHLQYCAGTWGQAESS